MRLPQKKRALLACIITLVGCSVAPVSQVLAETLPAGDKDTQTIAHALLTEQASIGDILLFSADTTSANIEPSSTFLCEVCNPAACGYTNIVVNEDSSIVGFSSTRNVAETFEELRVLLEQNNWTVATGTDSTENPSSVLATCTKEDGSIRWAYVSCVQLNTITSVVIQTHNAN